MTWENILEKEVKYPPYRYKFDPDKYKKWRTEQAKELEDEEEINLSKALNRWHDAMENNTEGLDKLEREPDYSIGEDDWVVEFRYINNGNVFAEEELIITGTWDSVEKEAKQLSKEYKEFIETAEPLNGRVSYHIMEA